MQARGTEPRLAWPGQALQWVIESKAQHREAFLGMLLADVDTQPLATDINLIGIVLNNNQRAWALPALLEAGFTLRPDRTQGQEPLKKLASALVRGQMGYFPLITAEVFQEQSFRDSVFSLLGTAALNTFHYNPGNSLMAQGFFSEACARHLIGITEPHSGLREMLARHRSTSLGREAKRPDTVLPEQPGHNPIIEGWILLRQAGVIDMTFLRQAAGGLGTMDADLRLMLREAEAALATRQMECDTAQVAPTKPRTRL